MQCINKLYLSILYQEFYVPVARRFHKGIHTDRSNPATNASDNWESGGLSSYTKWELLWNIYEPRNKIW